MDFIAIERSDEKFFVLFRCRMGRRIERKFRKYRDLRAAERRCADAIDRSPMLLGLLRFHLRRLFNFAACGRDVFCIPTNAARMWSFHFRRPPLSRPFFSRFRPPFRLVLTRPKSIETTPNCPMIQEI